MADTNVIRDPDREREDEWMNILSKGKIKSPDEKIKNLSIISAVGCSNQHW